jgi:hypothetical protein
MPRDLMIKIAAVLLLCAGLLFVKFSGSVHLNEHMPALLAPVTAPQEAPSAVVDPLAPPAPTLEGGFARIVGGAPFFSAVNGNPFAALRAGDRVRVVRIGAENSPQAGWVQVHHNGLSGWVQAGALGPDTPAVHR